MLNDFLKMDHFLTISVYSASQTITDPSAKILQLSSSPKSFKIIIAISFRTLLLTFLMIFSQLCSSTARRGGFYLLRAFSVRLLRRSLKYYFLSMFYPRFIVHVSYIFLYRLNNLSKRFLF